jgi:hypothetical protein
MVANGQQVGNRSGRPITARMVANGQHISIQSASNALKSLYDAGLLIRSSGISRVRGGVERKYWIDE